MCNRERWKAIEEYVEFAGIKPDEVIPGEKMPMDLLIDHSLGVMLDLQIRASGSIYERGTNENNPNSGLAGLLSHG